MQASSGTTVLFWQQLEQGALPSDPWSGLMGPADVAFRVEGTPAVTDANATSWGRVKQIYR